MTEKNDFKLDVVSIRLVKEAPIYSEQSFNQAGRSSCRNGRMYVPVRQGSGVCCKSQLRPKAY